MSPIERAFSIHDDAMVLRSQRSSILAANIANADTPNYKARDLDFSAMMQQVESRQDNQLRLASTDARHIAGSDQTAFSTIKFRNPLQPALDGNTVDLHAEQARFSQNAMQYQTSMTMMNSKIRGLLFAIKGQ